jgi:hypothetical protein
LMNAGAQWARARGCKLLHLGGVGDKTEGGLFEYKRSFGGRLYRYHTLDVIADESRYRELVEGRFKFQPDAQVRSGFFPQYRA